MEGRTLGRYKLIEEIGQGGMAVVWRGIDTTLKREVAVKILHPHLSRKEANRQRFAREARVVATLHHDNIVEIYDFSGGEEGTAAGDAYIVCEYIRGRTLAEFIERPRTVKPRDEDATGQSDAAVPLPPIPVEIGVLIAVEICEAVSHAHALGVVHRDIKPENVMIRQDGVVKLMDFGIARVNDDSGATMTGTLMGSPQYMSPEQAGGQELDARSDLFSIAILVYRLVTGTLPFDGPNPVAILRAIGEQTPEPADAKNARVPRALAATIRKALSKNPDERHASVAELRAELLASIADAGLAPREELRKYFADPVAYAAALTPALVTRYTAAGRAKVARKDLAGAMEVWSRVLELDPGNVEVRSALENLGRKNRNDRALTIGAAVIGAVLLASLAGPAAVRALTAHETPSPLASPPPSAPPSSLSPSPSPSPSPRPSPSPSPSSKPSPSPRASPSTVPSLAPSPIATATTVAMIATPFPPGMGAIKLVMPLEWGQVRIDDTVRANGVITLSHGEHRFRLEPTFQKGCEPLAGTFLVGESDPASPLPIRVLHTEQGDLDAVDGIYMRGCEIHFFVELLAEGGIDPGGVELRLDGAPAHWAKPSDFQTYEHGAKIHLLGRTGPGESIVVKVKGYKDAEHTFALRPKRTDDNDPVVQIQLEKK